MCVCGKGENCGGNGDGATWYTPFTCTWHHIHTHIRGHTWVQAEGTGGRAGRLVGGVSWCRRGTGGQKRTYARVGPVIPSSSPGLYSYGLYSVGPVIHSSSPGLYIMAYIALGPLSSVAAPRSLVSALRPCNAMAAENGIDAE